MAYEKDDGRVIKGRVGAELGGGGNRIDEVFPVRAVAKGAEARPLKRATAEPAAK